MTTKKVNLIKVIITSVALILLFIPSMYKMQLLVSIGYGMWKDGVSHQVSLFSCIGQHIGTVGDIFIVILLVALVLCLFLQIKQYLGNNEKQNSKYANYSSIFPLILFIIISILAGLVFPDMGESGVSYEKSVLFFVELALLIALVVVSLLSYRKYRKEGIIEYVTVKVSDNKPVGLDELEKLKSLYDGGVITQEEFNAKKKQILGL